MNNSKQNQPLLVSCHCSPLNRCPYSSSVCVSSTGCFHSLNLDLSLTYVDDESYGCFPNHTNQIDLLCRNSKVGRQLLYCCSANNGDLCNRNSSLLELIDPIRINAYGFMWRPILTAILFPTFALFCGLLAIMLFWKYFLKKRIKSYDRYANELACKRSSFTTDISNYLIKLNEEQFSDPKLSSHMSPRIKDKLSSKSANVPNPSSELISYTSGSGSGLPFLVQRTVARHIRLTMCIGKGRFGEVWKATCQGETVAVKIFSSRDEASWARETEVYNTGLLRHPNLLAYYASDMISRGGCTQLWLITAYHANGSLHDFLSHKSLKLQDGLRLAYSIAAGLAFLHTEIKGLHAKPSIAHRDLKSKNVLVMHDMTACIADLGLALVNLQSLPTGPVFLNLSSSAVCSGVLSSGVTQSDRLCSGFSGPPPAGPRVGTKRYMAPELLLAIDTTRIPTNCVNNTSCITNESVDHANKCHYLPFEVYQAADIYAMALVFWEIARCTQGIVSEFVEGYQIPFYDMVPSDPTFLQMRDIVCGNTSTVSDNQTNQHNTNDINVNTESSKSSADYDGARCRPRIYQRWLDDTYLCRYAQVIQECWHDDWSVRLSALCVRKHVEQIENALRKSLVKKREENILSNVNEQSLLLTGETEVLP
ncbi:Serine/threonine-protein kinase receptor R3 [Schistosoma japonicum]|uniref:receptor protein serine/threonine kinase n=1 Tax=Schistosoma japonicum TaxID=6182 RepID=A0A4Z2DWC5_SCHJA|nr:Serine/threonine-protein kinase receptor R3 [Schistosoma japonicum]